MSHHSDFDALLGEIRTKLEVLPDKPEETPENTLRALWYFAYGDARSVEAASESAALPDLDAIQAQSLRDLIAQRIAGTPLGHLTGRQRFMGMDFRVSPQALIPRKETESLGRAALDILKSLVRGRGEGAVLDVSTGSGHLALAFAVDEPGAPCCVPDLAEDAVAPARGDGGFPGLDSRVEFRVGNLCEPFADELAGNLDLLSCNPPYISSARVEAMPGEISEHEPKLAFDGGPFGVGILTRVIKRGPQMLQPASWLCIELGSGQGPAVERRLNRTGAVSEIRR